MDQLAAQGGSIWRNDVQVPRMLWSTYALCEDVMSLKRAVQQLDTLADEVPSVAGLRAAIHACYLTERGMPRDALTRHGPLFEALRAETDVRAAQYLGAYARILRKAGEPARAVQICEETLRRLDRRALSYTMLSFGLRLELPLSRAALGEYETARRLLDELLLEQQQHDNPLIHGLTHGARAELALAMQDREQAEQQLAAMGEWFRNTEHPALFAQFQRLADRERASKTSAIPALHHELGKARDEELLQGALRDVFARPEKALEQVLREAHAEHGYLYELTEDGLRLHTASGEPVLQAVSDELAQCIALQTDASFETAFSSESDEGAPANTLTTITTDASGALLSTRIQGKNAYWLPLQRAEQGAVLAVGALLLVEGAEPLKRLNTLLLTNLAQLLCRVPYAVQARSQQREHC